MMPKMNKKYMGSILVLRENLSVYNLIIIYLCLNTNLCFLCDYRLSLLHGGKKEKKSHGKAYEL